MNILPNILAQALDAHRNGKLAEAEKLYLSVPANDPHYIEAHYHLGTLKEPIVPQDKSAPVATQHKDPRQLVITTSQTVQLFFRRAAPYVHVRLQLSLANRYQ
jgi:hypothetical protein